jgi:uncharacterized membrane protein YkvA (DUF1232 family)
MAGPDTPLRLRIWLVLLLSYLPSPIDLVPDFVPVLGYADYAVVVALALRAVARPAVREPWPGTGPVPPEAWPRCTG